MEQDNRYEIILNIYYRKKLFLLFFTRLLRLLSSRFC